MLIPYLLLTLDNSDDDGDDEHDDDVDDDNDDDDWLECHHIGFFFSSNLLF